MEKSFNRFRKLKDVLAGEADENYTLQTSISNDDLTVSLKTLAGADATAVTPIFIRVNNTLVKITAALSVTITDAMGDTFGWDVGKIQGNDSQLFVYLINNNGTPQLGVSPCPMLATVATNYRDAVGQTGAAGHTNMVMSGTRHATNSAANIGRVNVQQTDANLWSAPTISRVINRPIFETDELAWSPIYTGASSGPTALSRYQVLGNYCIADERETGDATSDSTSFSMTGPIVPYNLTGMVWHTGLYTVRDNNAFVANVGDAYIFANSNIITLVKTPGAATSWTAANGKRANFNGFRWRVS